MFECKKVISCFFFIFSLFYSFSSQATQALDGNLQPREELDSARSSRAPELRTISVGIEEVSDGGTERIVQHTFRHDFDDAPPREQWDAVLHGSASINAVISPPPLSADDQDKKILDISFKQNLAQVPVPLPAQRIIAAAGAAGASFVSSQTALPAEMIGLDRLGLTENVLPSGSPGAYAVLVGAGVTAVVVGAKAAASGVIELFRKPPPEVLAAQRITNDRSYTRLENATYSYVTQGFQMLFWGTLVFSFIMNIESNVTGWGNTTAWGIVFGVCALPAIYAMFVRATNNPNRNPFRPYGSENERKEKAACLRPILAAENFIQHNGSTPETDSLARTMSIIARPPTSSINVVGPILDAGSLEERRGQEEQRQDLEPASAGRDSLREMSTVSLTQAHRYQIALQRIQAILEKNSPSCLSCCDFDKNYSWTSTIAKWESATGQTLGSLGMGLATYLFFNVLGQFCTLSPTDAAWVAGGATLLVAPLIGLTSFKEVGLSKQESEQRLHLYKPQSGSGFVGERIAPIYARGFSFIISVALTDFVRQLSANPKYLGLPIGAQLAFLIPFGAYKVYSPLAQFLDKHLTEISEWFASGGPMGCCKLAPCKDRDLKVANTIGLSHRLKNFRLQVEDLNPKFTRLLLQDTPPSERASLLPSGN